MKPDINLCAFFMLRASFRFYLCRLLIKLIPLVLQKRVTGLRFRLHNRCNTIKTRLSPLMWTAVTIIYLTDCLSVNQTILVNPDEQNNSTSYKDNKRLKALIITGSVAAVFAVAVGLFCYRRRQLRSVLEQRFAR